MRQKCLRPMVGSRVRHCKGGLAVPSCWGVPAPGLLVVASTPVIWHGTRIRRDVLYSYRTGTASSCQLLQACTAVPWPRALASLVTLGLDDTTLVQYMARLLDRPASPGSTVRQALGVAHTQPRQFFFMRPAAAVQLLL